MDAAVRASVLRRDGQCIIAKLHLEPGHICRNRWGTAHAPTDLHQLTVEHVKDHLAMGKRAPSDPAHLVAMCWAGNVGVPSKAMRAAIREYLALY